MRMGVGGGSEKSGELQVQWKQAGVCGVAVLSWCISPNSPMSIYSTGVQAVNTLHYHIPRGHEKRLHHIFILPGPYKPILP